MRCRTNGPDGFVTTGSSGEIHPQAYDLSVARVSNLIIKLESDLGVLTNEHPKIVEDYAVESLDLSVRQWETRRCKTRVGRKKEEHIN